MLQRAAAAFERGDTYLEVQHPRLLRAGTYELSRTGRPAEPDGLLDALSAIGWTVEHASYLGPGHRASPLRSMPRTTATRVMCVYLLRAVRTRRPLPNPA